MNEEVKKFIDRACLEEDVSLQELLSPSRLRYLSDLRAAISLILKVEYDIPYHDISKALNKTSKASCNYVRGAYNKVLGIPSFRNLCIRLLLLTDKYDYDSNLNQILNKKISCLLNASNQTLYNQINKNNELLEALNKE